MATFFLIIIYLAFISLGLPDSLLGAVWPIMQSDYDVPLETAGMIFMVIAGSTIVSSLMSGKVLARFGTGKVTLVSCILTAGALLGFAVSPSLIWLILCAIPLGIGGGSVDSGLNNYVAAHYKAHHMSWLHCFWGVGATLGPMIMAPFITGQGAWRQGYLMVAGIQLGLVIILFVTLPLWKRVGHHGDNTEPKKEFTDEAAIEADEAERLLSQPKKPLQVKGVKLALATFLFYCAVEATMGLWGSSFLVNVKDMSAASAAKWVSLFYAGITIGRFITGFITFKMTNRMLIRVGQVMTLAGAAFMLLPLPTSFALAGFMIVGLGLAPIFPCMLHETPERFGKKHSQSIMGFQMALAYTGSTFMPPLLGFVAAYSTIGIFPSYIVICALAMLLFSERLNGILKKKHHAGANKPNSLTT
ncbi:MFS transporter [Paenibacillus harenae]|uniref:MFS transporter n=1 Tax=Paenibacillus harenae TaxID=306543 RepID=UPI00279324B7|nr:MFS transporter [Paenibacillus harenae]MDQ0060325.1 fucose permease [Paenibacillus harenae]